MWIEGNQAIDTDAGPNFDWNKHYSETLVGQLSDEEAAKTLGCFFMHNIGLMATALTGQILEPYQRITIKGWMQKNFSLTIASRSWGKSMCFSHFCYLYALLNPGKNIIICSATFRSSRQVVERIDAWARSKRGGLLKATFQSEMTKRQDLVRITFKNGSTITALPLGDPDNLRGNRCNVLGIDEGLLIPQSTINMVLKPFLAGGSDATKKQMIRLREKRLIGEGKMKEEQRQIFKPDSKMIILSSASYKWEELYKVYCDYRAIIEGGQINGKEIKPEENEAGASSYLVHQFSYEAANPDLIDKGVLNEIKNNLLPKAVIDREYRAQFIDESGGYFSAKEMNACTIPNGSQPSVEIVGEMGAEYILGIDPSIGSDVGGDNFAMVVLKIVERATDKKKIPMVVHQYACAGVELKHHIQYFYYLLKSFNIVYIICDTTQGQNLSFLNICNESQLFKERKLELLPIQAEFAKEDWSEMIKAAKRSYNPSKSANRIVQQQYFSSSIIKAGNEHLRACFDSRQILFASKAQSIENQMQKMVAQDVMGIYRSHPAFFNDNEEGGSEKASIWEFILMQDALMDQVKKECALIEVKSTPLGHIVFDLPSHMSKDRKNARRNRKDLYSALWLGCWATKIYLSLKEAPEEESNDTFQAFFA